MKVAFQQVSEQCFEISMELDGKRIGHIKWIEQDDTMIMNSTNVSENFSGQGIAKKLLDEAATYARQKGYKMEATCSYVVVAFKRYKEYDDVKK